MVAHRTDAAKKFLPCWQLTMMQPYLVSKGMQNCPKREALMTNRSRSSRWVNPACRLTPEVESAGSTEPLL